MHFAKAFVFAAVVLAGGAFAAPNPTKPAKPVKPAPPSTVGQTNSCGGGTSYCCNGGDGSTANLGTCQAQGNIPVNRSVMGLNILGHMHSRLVICTSVVGTTCNVGGTTVCCQANDAIQVCLAGATAIV